MVELVIRDESLARKLLNIAHREGRSVDDLLRDFANSYQATSSSESNAPGEKHEPEPGTLGMLLKTAEEANIRAPQPVDTSSRTNEILQAEYGEYLRQRLDEQSDTG